MNITVTIPGLAEAVADCPVTKSHAGLQKVMRKFAGLEKTTLTGIEGLDGRMSLVKKKVLDAHGTVVHDDLGVWMKNQLAEDFGNARATYNRLVNAGFVISNCRLTVVYLVHDHGGAESNYLQAEIHVEDEWTDRLLFDPSPYSAPREPADLMDTHGPAISEAARVRIRPTAYRLARVVNVGALTHAMETEDLAERNAFKQRRFIREEYGVPSREVDVDEAFPGWDKEPLRAKRVFCDWQNSSAGRSGARFWEHWMLDVQDRTDGKGERFLNYTPAWTTTLKLAKIPGNQGSAYEVFGKLEALDKRVGVPFAWFFFMLHGNRVKDAAGHKVLEAAEAGLIVLPEHDYQVLKAWSTHCYGF